VQGWRGPAHLSPEAFVKTPYPYLLLFADDPVAGGAERDRRQHRQRDRKLHLPLRVPLGHHVSNARVPRRGKHNTGNGRGLLRDVSTAGHRRAPGARGGTAGRYASAP